MSKSAPKGEAEHDDQGNLDTCTRFAMSKAAGNGFYTKKTVLGNQIDIGQDFIVAALLNEHKVLIAKRTTFCKIL